MMKINKRDLTLEEQKQYAYAAYIALNDALQKAAKVDSGYRHLNKGRFILNPNVDLRRDGGNNGTLYDAATGQTHDLNVWFGSDSDVRLQMEHFEDVESGLGVRVKDASQHELFRPMLAFIVGLNINRNQPRLLCA